MWITVLIIVGCVLGYVFLWALTSALLSHYANIESSESMLLGFAVPVFLPIGLAAFLYQKISKWLER